MEALSVGMYVRHKTLLSSKYVKINKIKEIEEKENCLHIWLEDKDLITEKYLIKASYNIIDILERGDYVSTITGECAVIAGVYNDINSKKYLRLCNCIGEYYEDDIKSIVTHEQMEQMAYKVGD